MPRPWATCISSSYAQKSQFGTRNKMLYDTRPFYTERLQKLALPTQRSFEIPLTHGGRAQVQLLLPPSWREELRDAAFPVIVEVYAS